jgi:hypothetical protein
MRTAIVTLVFAVLIVAAVMITSSPAGAGEPGWACNVA